MKIKKLYLGFCFMFLFAAAGIFAGAAVSAKTNSEKTNSGKANTENETPDKSTDEKNQALKSFVFGDTAFNSENETATIDPHSAYCGWSCIRYGVGETLFKINEDMELEPWIAESYERTDDTTWVITLKDGVCFSNGKTVDARAVKECFEDLIRMHARAAGDLHIASLEAEGLALTIRTEGAQPGLLHYLSEPYACIMDMEEGVTEEGIVIGTGPYKATELVSDHYLKLIKNENYWDGDVSVDEITVRSITDGDTLALALQSGEIDAAYGMAYTSYPLFENENYTFSSVQTSRAFFVQMNFSSEIIQDEAVRKAIAMGIDKVSFVENLLDGYGYVGKSAFPEELAFGGKNVTTEGYDPEGAAKVLEKAGWIDTDGDGIREKGGQKLTIRWLTYPSRQELPVLAEAAQATLKKIGIEVQINSTANHNSVCKDSGAWDVYAGAYVTAGLGDPSNFFSTYCLDSSTKNRGAYHSDTIEALAVKMNGTFDDGERAELAVEMQQELLDDHAFVFCSFLKMSIISRSNVTGLKAWPCDFYELTAELDVQ